MPNRMIRESCRTSPTLDQLSDGAERMFWRLTTAADDYGRFEADPRILLSHCFPLRVNRIKTDTVHRWLQEMVTCGLVTAYVSGGRKYAFFSTWEKHQRLRAKHSKFPEPTSADICQRVADIGGHPLSNVAENLDERRELETRGERRELPKGDDSFDLFWKAYPNRKAKGDAEKAWRKIKPDADLLQAILAAIERQKASDGWTKAAGQYIPYPATWLNQRRWEDEETVAPPSQASPIHPHDVWPEPLDVADGDLCIHGWFTTPELRAKHGDPPERTCGACDWEALSEEEKEARRYEEGKA